MREVDMIYEIIVTLVFGGLFLIFTKMILNFFRDRKKSPGASLGTSELETLIQRAVEAGTGSIHDRLDHLEHRLDQVDDKIEVRPRALPEVQPLLEVEPATAVEPVAAIDVHHSRSTVR